MKHAIIPTDFTTQSLKPVHDVMRHYKNDQVRITLLHLLEMPTAIGDLLFRLRKMETRYPIPEAFKQACEMMANKYEGHLTSIIPQIEYGNNRFYIENLIEGFKADAIFIQPDYELTLPFEESIKMLPLIRRSDCKVIALPAARTERSVGVTAMSNLLLANG